MNDAPAAARPESDAILARLLELHPKIIDLSLDRVWRLLAAMGHPERALPPVVHIAGTNGKGSTLAMLRAGLEAEGARVHAYTSPHLVRFHERIRVAGQLIAEPDLAALLEDCERANGAAPITFFEITTVAALVAFAQSPADWTLLEVGLGGRLDATNVIDRPRLTVITPVSLDHQQYLGETLGQIAGEKAGILKPAVPCVVAPQAEAARRIIEERAADLGAPLSLAGRDWHARAAGGRLEYEDAGGRLTLPLPRLPGAHQVENAGTAVAALRHLATGDAGAAMTRPDWPARMQALTWGPAIDALPRGTEVWLDGGHNAAAGAALAEHLATLHDQTPAPLWLIAGMLETKDIEAFFRPLVDLAEGVAAVPIPASATALAPETLAHRAQAAGHRAASARSLTAAAGLIRAARPEAPLRVVICGSLYLAGAVLAEHG
ncbi:MAG: bifunctional folylpolyglutamate synthase/dihydrofolate synthase [Paracoccaceae bacterium]